VLVFDITERQSFENIVKWLESVKSYGEKNTSISLVANKIDLVESGEKARAVS
jgi:Ras-related protein Rab-2A